MSQEMRLEKDRKEQVFRGLEFSHSLSHLSYICLVFTRHWAFGYKDNSVMVGQSLPSRKSQMLVSQMLCHLVETYKYEGFSELQISQRVKWR